MGLLVLRDEPHSQEIVSANGGPSHNVNNLMHKFMYARTPFIEPIDSNLRSYCFHFYNDTMNLSLLFGAENREDYLMWFKNSKGFSRF
jgi:hypothetical protein